MEVAHEYLDERMDMLVKLMEAQCVNIDELCTRYEGLKGVYSAVRRSHGVLEDRIFRLETTLDVMCHSLGIKLVEPLAIGGNRPTEVKHEHSEGNAADQPGSHS